MEESDQPNSKNKKRGTRKTRPSHKWYKAPLLFFITFNMTLSLRWMPASLSTSPIATSVVQKEETTDPLPVYFSKARTDRSGAFITDMLLCHAYVFHKESGVYGGACPYIKIRTWPAFKRAHQKLLTLMGLQNVLQIACPEEMHINRTTIRALDDVPIDRSVQEIVLDDKTYRSNDTRIWTPDYVQHIRSLVEYKPYHKDADKWDAPTMAVHIRRGDVDPCNSLKRYLPNSHFLELIEQYKEKLPKTKNGKQEAPRIVIFSESYSYENFDEFTQRGYEVILDGDINRVWQTILGADVLIMSKSGFSIVPAMLSRAKTVVYTPFWHEPLEHWDVVDEGLHNRSMNETTQYHAKADADRVLTTISPSQISTTITFSTALGITDQPRAGSAVPQILRLAGARMPVGWRHAQIRKGLGIMVATPGRLLGHLSKTESLLLVLKGKLEWLVLDEADRLLDMGLGDPVRQIVQRIRANEGRTDHQVRSVLVSATVTQSVQALAQERMLGGVRDSQQSVQALAQERMLGGDKEWVWIKGGKHHNALCGRGKHAASSGIDLSQAGNGGGGGGADDGSGATTSANANDANNTNKNSSECAIAHAHATTTSNSDSTRRQLAQMHLTVSARLRLGALVAFLVQRVAKKERAVVFTDTCASIDHHHKLFAAMDCIVNNTEEDSDLNEHDGVVKDVLLQQNRLTGSFDPILFHLDLTFVWLFENNINGSIPSYIGNLNRLMQFEIDSNPLTGTIPTEIGNLSTLQWLNVYSTQMNGTIPTEIGRCTNLVGLGIHDNELEGIIPSELGELTALNNLSLGENNVHGTVPTELSQLTLLKWLYVEKAMITGNLDPLFCTGPNEFPNMEEFGVTVNAMVLGCRGQCVPAAPIAAIRVVYVRLSLSNRQFAKEIALHAEMVYLRANAKNVRLQIPQRLVKCAGDLVH
eukprot:CAMPEP_0119572732 /NCGR_PEP_ID=MMETSP1352-20130426/44769_1 /TAXON_ID=265584 /ORGANISM="Stauroneis constricta, Strain CCMP1120" /LENGTH=927 /DNA_ID=CAMNT_0007622419 /DNA_START=21 /DNA_END=2808 /DNA_ORIENTATION=-